MSCAQERTIEEFTAPRHRAVVMSCAQERTIEEFTAPRHRAVVLGALGAVILIAWPHVLFGAGMGMSAWEMSSRDLALGRPDRSPVVVANDH